MPLKFRAEIPVRNSTLTSRKRSFRWAMLGAVATGMIVAAGCSSSDDQSSFGGSATDQNGAGDSLGAPSEVDRSNDAGDGSASTTRGNLLCHAQWDSICFPDQKKGCAIPDGGASLTVDGSTADGGTSVSSVGACHVRQTAAGDAGSAATVCMSAGAGEDGAECIRSTDCAGGFECVGSPGQCRHYCCDGADSCNQGEKQHFCDVQSVLEQGGLKVPVCMPIRPCALLGEGCAEGETCSVVNDEGATSCVGVGPAHAGESCETTHCDKGLVCLGQPESRRCYKLCQKSSNMACGTGEKCTGQAPLFMDSNVGICKKP